jgi:AcrR family transcriptional regulator
MHPVSTPKTRGRPREFDIETALDQAIGVFRERGYHGTSVADIRRATSLTAGSIYKAFPDKYAVFLAAFDRYVATSEAVRAAKAARNAPGRDILRDVLDNYSAMSSGVEGQRGCLIISSAVEMAALDDVIGQRVRNVLARFEALLASIIRQGRADGSIRANVDEAAASRLILSLALGMRVVGKAGRTRAEMTAVVDLAMAIVT